MRKIAACLILGLLLGGLSGAAPAQAGVVGKSLGEMGANEQVQNAGDALEKSFITLATKGRATRGAKGALAELALNSGELICSAWIISFRVHIRNMIIENARLRGAEQTRHLQLIQEAQLFAEQLELECGRVGLLGNPATGGKPTEGAGGAEGGGGAPDEMLPEPEDAAQTINRRPGETVADAICRHRCQPYLDRLTEEQRWLVDMEKRQQRAAKEVQQKNAATQRLRKQVSDLQKELNKLNEITKASYRSEWSSARKDEWTSAQARSGRIKSNLNIVQGKLDQAAKAEEAARAHLKIMQRAVVSQRQRVQTAQQAYNDCLRRCLMQAAAAGDSTTIVCPEPAAHKSASIGANDKVGSRAQLGSDIKKSLGGGAGLGGLLGGSGGGTF
ncbi:MAG: hypothetical protein RH942_15175, partial [Kiloniellaceae bacterium]